MPHLITIIKYACNIVKYLLVLLSALFQKAVLVSCSNSTSGSFYYGWRPKWLRFVYLGKGVNQHGSWPVGTGREPVLL